MSSSATPGNLTELRPRITVIGVGGAGGNAINNMIASGIEGVDFVAANTDAQALISSSADRRIQLGVNLTEGLGAGAKPDIGAAAAQEAIEEIKSAIAGSHMVFIAAGMGGGTGTGATSVVAKLSREMGILTVAIVTKPFNFEGNRRMRAAEVGIEQLRGEVDTLIVIPNQNLFRIATERTTFAESFLLADQVLHSGIACITDLIVREGLINLDFADVRTVMAGMGTAMMGTGEASGEKRAIEAAEQAILNPLLDDVSLRGARGLLISISGNRSLTLYEVDEAASRVRKEVDAEADIIIGATFDETLGDKLRVSIVASGLRPVAASSAAPSRPVQEAVVARAEPVPQMADMAPPVYQQPYAPEADEVAYQPYDEPEHEEQAAASYDWGQGEQSPPYGEAPAQNWDDSGDVVIELGSPYQTEAPAYPVEPGFGSAQPGFNPPQFRPRPPMDPSRPARRLPEVEDFPEFAQAAYRAKRPDPKAPQPAETPKKRPGLFDFLKSRKPAPDTTFESPEDAWPPPSRPRDAEELFSRGKSASAGGAPVDRDVAQTRRIPMPRHRPR
jgi:cell division protein FtsZ